MRLTRTRTATSVVLLLTLCGVLSTGAQANSSPTYPADTLTMDPSHQQRPELAAVLAQGMADGQTDEETLSSWVAKHRSAPGVKPAAQLDDLDVADIEDLLNQKQASTTPIAEIIAKYGSQQDFQDASWEMAKEFPDTYAGMRYRVGDDDRVRLFFKGAVPAAASNLVANLPEEVVLEGGDYVPLGQQQRITDKSLAVLKPLIKDYSVAFDTGRQSVSVHIYDADRSRVPELTDAVAKVVSPIHVVVETGLEPFKETDSTMRGGAYLDWPISGTNSTQLCTAGFVVEGTYGTKRLGTAGHCISDTNDLASPNATYRLHGSDGASTTSVTNGWFVYGTGTPDLGYTSTGTFSPIGTFYYEPGLKRSVQGAASSRYDVGTSVCFFGRTTYNGPSCGVVTSAAYSVSAPAGSYGMVQTSAPTQVGDSGGPVYRGNWAVGQTKGTDGTHGYYTPVFQYGDYGLHVLLY